MIGINRTLVLWKQPPAIANCGGCCFADLQKLMSVGEKNHVVRIRSSHHTSWNLWMNQSSQLAPNQPWACNLLFQNHTFPKPWISIFHTGGFGNRKHPFNPLLGASSLQGFGPKKSPPPPPPPGMVLKPWDMMGCFLSINWWVFRSFEASNVVLPPLKMKDCSTLKLKGTEGTNCLFLGDMWYVSCRVVISYIFVMCESVRLSHWLREIRRTCDPVSDQAPLGTPTLPVAMSWAFPTSPRKHITHPLAGWGDYMAPICCWHFA